MEVEGLSYSEESPGTLLLSSSLEPVQIRAMVSKVSGAEDGMETSVHVCSGHSSKATHHTLG